MKTVKLIVHTKAGRAINVSMEAEDNQAAIMQIKSELYFGADQPNGNTEVIIVDEIDGFTILGGK